MRKLQSMTLDQCAVRMTKLLAKKPTRAVSRNLLKTLPKRDSIIVSASDYPCLISKAVAKAEGRMAKRDAQRYANWEARGKPPSPTAPVRKKRIIRHKDPEARRLLLVMAEAQGMMCAGCGGHLYQTDDERMAMSFDHVVPRSKGGVDQANRIVMHRHCNGAKANRLPTGCELIWLAVVNAKLAIKTPA